jgi:dipeptidyl aminopeptidase/acylaminoacyl peptidase
MQPMHFFRFKTRDGALLDAYLTLPAKVSKDHPAPMIVLSHGGPFMRDVWGFQPEVQYLASLGYAVLQPNYRTTTGNAVQMADDLSDAVALALRTHLVDTKRIAIVGRGFGGYLALVGAARNPSAYRCAITIGGISDWAAFVRDGKFNQYSDPGYAALKRDLASVSAGIAVDQIKAPVFVYHEEDDPIVSVDESRHLVSALGKSNVPHEEMIVGGDDSGRHHLEDRVEMWNRVRAFLAKNL